MRRTQLWATIGAVATALLLTAAPAAADTVTQPDRTPTAVSTMPAGTGPPGLLSRPAAPSAPALFGGEVHGTFSRSDVPVLYDDALDDYPCLFGTFGCRPPVLERSDLQRGDTMFTSTVRGAPLTACLRTSEWMSVRFDDPKWGPIEGLVTALAVDIGSAEPGWC